MKKIILTISALVLVSSAVFSQEQLDAYRMAQTDLFGTARYMSMGGAFGALGGDISVMNVNPAGLAVYRSSEFVTTLSLNSASSESNWEELKATGSRTRLYFDNIAYVTYFPTSSDEGLLGWNVGFSYNRVKNFNKSYSLRGNANSLYSLSDYMAERAYGINVNDLKITSGYDPYSSKDVNDWLSVLGYDAGYFESYKDNNKKYYSAFGENDGSGKWNPYQLKVAELNVNEWGGIDQYDIAFGLNISNKLMLGATVAITDISYHYTSYYTEDFVNANYLKLDNWLDTEGTGYGFNIGAIAQPVDFFRLGVAYNSPTWYKAVDYYRATATADSHFWNEKYTSDTPGNASTEYEFRSPDRWIFSGAVILGRTALLSVDYELTNYKNMKLYDVYNDGGVSENQYSNTTIRDNFGNAGTLRVGAEVKVTPQFAVRAGAAWIGNPMKSALTNATEEVKTVGTIPHYTIEKSLSNYTIGLGYRFTPSVYLDLACILRSQKEDLYVFSKIFDNGELITDSKPASLKTNTTRVALTFGYKF
ncbi:MAG: outer membrane protein transport protein [Tannerellaceae bacterium]|jgi:long-subunit fatty acid transport protein|nr:outer membrane protein transport protein [Tannerellaceae bacterium]